MQDGEDDRHASMEMDEIQAETAEVQSSERSGFRTLNALLKKNLIVKVHVMGIISHGLLTKPFYVASKFHSDCWSASQNISRLQPIIAVF